MVVNKIIQHLGEIGFSVYEARLYVALIQTNPATAYEAARLSGIPTSKVYEVIARLLDKGIILAIESDKKKRYIPIAPEEFVEQRKSKLENTFDALRSDLRAINSENDLSYIWNVHEYDYLTNKAERIIKNARKTLLISAWKEELSLLRKTLIKKENINIAVVHFGDIEFSVGQLFRHPIEDTIFNEKGGRGFALIADSREALMATIHEDEAVEGAWSMNKGFVTLAEDYIKHDIYIMKIVKRMDTELQNRFGKNYVKLRDIFNDEEVSP